MEILVFFFSLASWAIAAPLDNDSILTVANTTDPNKDMYVIHAMVYQVGILTNKTDEENSGNMTGNQEALTLYHTNGSDIDLSGLPAPLLTNVTAQRMVGVAPADAVNSTFGTPSLPWAYLENLASLPSTTNADSVALTRRDLRVSESKSNQANYIPYPKSFSKRSISPSKEYNEEPEKTSVKIVNGAAMIPQEAGVQSLTIPSLLSLNNNFSEIPIPIPNTAVVHYAKVNTLIHAPTAEKTLR